MKLKSLFVATMFVLGTCLILVLITAYELNKVIPLESIL